MPYDATTDGVFWKHLVLLFQSAMVDKKNVGYIIKVTWRVKISLLRRAEPPVWLPCYKFYCCTGDSIALVVTRLTVCALRVT